MKLFVLIFMIFSSAPIVWSQQDAELPGIVVEQNSKFYKDTTIYIPNVQIKSSGANPIRSGQNGEFTLIFSDKPPGKVVMVYASKYKYEVVNQQVLNEGAVLGRNTPLEIVMCVEGGLRKNQIAFYKITEAAALKELNKNIAILKTEGKEREKLIAKLQKEFDQKISTSQQAYALLHKQNRNLEEQYQKIADKFLTINLDDQSKTYHEAFRAFLEKDMDKTMKILDSVDLEKSLANNFAEKEKKEAIVTTNLKDIAIIDKKIQQNIDMSILKARLHIMRFQFAEAESKYELALKYKDNDQNLILEYALFLHRQNKFKKALNLYEQVLKSNRTLAKKNPEVYMPILAGNLNNLGITLRYNNMRDSAKSRYQEALKIFRTLAEKKPEVYLPEVAKTLDNLGILFMDRQDIDTAKIHYQEAIKIYKNLEHYNPDFYSPEIARISRNLGVSLEKNNERETAKIRYYEALKIYRTLAKKKPDVYMQEVAMTLNNLGYLLTDTEVGIAVDYFEEALKIYAPLAKKNPDVYMPKIARTLNNLGILLKKNDELDAANVAFLNALEINRDFSKKNPEVFLPEVAMNLVNLGNLLKGTTMMATAKPHYEEALEIYRTLAEKSPKEYNFSVCITAINLGNLYTLLVQETGDKSLIESGISLIEEIKNRLSIYPAEHPKVIKYTEYVKRLSNFYANYQD